MSKINITNSTINMKGDNIVVNSTVFNIEEEDIKNKLLKELETYSNILPLIKEIYNGVEVKIPTEHAELYVLSSALIAFSPLANEGQLINLLIYIDKLPDEFGILILIKIIALQDVREKIISPEWVYLTKKYKGIILSSTNPIE